MKLRSMEAGRGLAALLVALSHSSDTVKDNPALHAGPVLGGIHFPGGPGVEFFFVLSGFVMMLGHHNDFGQARRIPVFLWRRFCRIYPLFWVVMLALLWQFWGVPQLRWGRIGGMLSLLPGSLDNLLIVAWSLRQEISFYIMLALAMLPWVGRPILAAWVAAVLTVNFGWVVVAMGPFPAAFVSAFSIEFFAGLLCGWLLLHWRPSPRTAAILFAASVAALVWRLSLDNWGVEYGPTLARAIYGACYGGVILSLAQLERAGALRLGAWAGVAGAASYPLYLSHPVTVAWIADWTAANAPHVIGGNALVAAMLAASVLVALVLSYGVDRPLQRLLRRA